MKKLIAVLLSLTLIMSGFAFAETAEVSAQQRAASDETVQKAPDSETETAEAEPTEKAGRLAGITIGIDPGHQEHQNSEKELVSPKGKEKKAKVSSGTSGYKTKIPEYKTVLEIALQFRDALEAEGATVVMTRETNEVNISNYERAMLMNDSGAQLVLRLHCDGSTKHSTHGITMYVRKSIAYGKAIVPEPKKLLEEETTAAQYLVDAMCEATGANNRGVCKRDTYTMNNWSTVPIILVEMGFMSNADEDVKLNDASYQALLVQGMVNGVLQYFGR